MKVPPVPLRMLSRRCEAPSELEKNFLDRIIGKFEEKRELDLVTFRKDSSHFLSQVDRVATEYKDTFEDNSRKILSVRNLSKILKKSPPTIMSLFPVDMVVSISKTSAANGSLDVILIKELINIYIHSETIFIKMVSYSENGVEISQYQLQSFICDNYVDMMTNKPENREYYAAYVVGVIFFLLDSRRRYCVKIEDILKSLLLFHMERCIAFENGDTINYPPVDAFTVQSFSSVLHEFRLLDEDRDGVLSEKEMMYFRDSFYNRVFVSRVFQISLTYEKGFLDFKGFIDLICAINFRHTKASVKFHYEAFDLKEDGFLDIEEVRELVLGLYEITPDDLPPVDTFVAELLDMLKPMDSLEKLTLTEFLSNRMSVTLSGCLTNRDSLGKYERREQ